MIGNTIDLLSEKKVYWLMKKKSPLQPLPVVHKTPLYICLFFLGLLLTGIAVGEPNRVMEQAWQICLSCIGIG